MDVLVLGGTVFLSRAVAELAVASGHNVTTFNRGRTGSPVAGARAITGDRTRPEELAQLAGMAFDLVFDTGYLPELVNAAARLLEPSAAHYAFTSSINAYPGWPEAADYHAGGVYDGDPDAVGEQVPDGLDGAGPYGWRKVGAERAVLRAFGPDRTSILRAGLIIGPRDASGRLPWWLDRIARGGEILAPGEPTDPVRFIDARDIAEFALTRPPGTFEVTGPAGQATRGELLEQARSVTGSDAEFVWVPDEVLDSAGIEGWTELPLWLPAAAAPSAWRHDTTTAEAAGLRTRPLGQTLADTWAWMSSVEGGWKPSEGAPGLTPARERQVLADYRS